MRKMWRKIIGTAVLAFMLCLTGLVISGTAFGGGGGQCEDNGDGTVTDNGSGLMWQKATAGPMNWHDAYSYAYSLSLGGYSNWQLPTRNELKGLFNSRCKDLVDGSELYWSSTTGASNTNYAWLVCFYSGRVDGYLQSDSYYVRAVRPAQ